VTGLPLRASNEVCEIEQKPFVEFSKMSLCREDVPAGELDITNQPGEHEAVGEHKNEAETGGSNDGRFV
jgi:hypothetical protein